MSQAARWIVRWRPVARPRLRLLCFPYAGGGASVYRSWPGQLPHDVEVCAVQLPGRESRLGEPPYTDMAELLPALAEALGDLLETPYATFGHSLGGLVSFELVRHLRAAGTPLPRYLVAAGRRPPQLPDRDPPIHRLPDEEFALALRRIDGTDPQVFDVPELIRLLFPVIRADLAISERYRYRPDAPLECPIIAFCGTADPSVTPAEAALWREHTSAGFSLRALPGGHFFLREAGPQLLAQLNEVLARPAPAEPRAI